MPSGVVMADMLEGIRFALGPAVALRRDALDAIGGIRSTADYYSDDYVLGNKIWAAGYRVIFSHHVIYHVLTPRPFLRTLGDQLRWMKSTRHSRPWGHIGTGLTFAMPFGMLALVAAWLGGSALLGLSLFAWAALNRILLALIVGWGVTRDRQLLRLCWLYPVRDLCGFVLWVASFFGTRVVWRGETYKLTSGGKMVPAQRSASSVAAAASGSSSRTVAIDDFA